MDLLFISLIDLFESNTDTDLVDLKNISFTNGFLINNLTKTIQFSKLRMIMTHNGVTKSTKVIIFNLYEVKATNKDRLQTSRRFNHNLLYFEACSVGLWLPEAFTPYQTFQDGQMCPFGQLKMKIHFNSKNSVIVLLPFEITIKLFCSVYNNTYKNPCSKPTPL